MGYGYGLLLLLLLLGAINYSNSLGHLLTFLLASLGWVGMYHNYRNLRHIEFSHAEGEAVFCGQTALLQLHLFNRFHRDSYQIDIAYRATEPERSWLPFSFLRGYRHLNTAAELPAQQSKAITVQLETHQRGWLHLGRFRLASQFPLGLFNSWTYVDSRSAILVYPAPAGELPLPNAKQYGNSNQQQEQRGIDDFAGFDAYRLGEPMHAVAWKALARDEKLRTKQFSSPQGLDIILSWHEVGQLNSTEARLSQLCQWLLKAEQLGLQYSLVLPAQCVPSGHGDIQLQRCLKMLALYEND
jgi:uncharacterized protein (DUF58 family)